MNVCVCRSLQYLVGIGGLVVRQASGSRGTQVQIPPRPGEISGQETNLTCVQPQPPVRFWCLVNES